MPDSGCEQLGVAAGANHHGHFLRRVLRKRPVNLRHWLHIQAFLDDVANHADDFIGWTRHIGSTDFNAVTNGRLFGPPPASESFIHYSHQRRTLAIASRKFPALAQRDTHVLKDCGSATLKNERGTSPSAGTGPPKTEYHQSIQGPAEGRP